MKIVKIQKGYKSHKALWGIPIGENLYVKCSRDGTPHMLDGYIVIDENKRITRESTVDETLKIAKVLKKGKLHVGTVTMRTEPSYIMKGFKYNCRIATKEEVDKEEVNFKLTIEREITLMEIMKRGKFDKITELIINEVAQGNKFTRYLLYLCSDNKEYHSAEIEHILKKDMNAFYADVVRIERFPFEELPLDKDLIPPHYRYNPELWMDSIKKSLYRMFKRHAHIPNKREEEAFGFSFSEEDIELVKNEIVVK